MHIVDILGKKMLGNTSAYKKQRFQNQTKRITIPYTVSCYRFDIIIGIKQCSWNFVSVKELGFFHKNLLTAQILKAHSSSDSQSNL